MLRILVYRWFVLGSLCTLIIALIVYINTYMTTGLGSDDSILSENNFRIIWILMMFSGTFFTIGSLAFLRAVNDPPLKPMFTWYHISTDELVGSWSFLIAIVPAVPYSLIFLTTVNAFVYVAMFIVSLFCVAATAFFVKASYPSVSKHDVSHISVSSCIVSSRIFYTFIRINCTSIY